ncbi:MAG: arylsulfatase [Isosphaeraceae bacterium]|nr:arylsulfatase [Isosphaeraceae bacterium]
MRITFVGAIHAAVIWVSAWGFSMPTDAWSDDPRPAAEARRPHVVYFLADDLGWGDVGWHGGEIATPHLDALAKAGARLEQFYVQPVCSPTRAAFMTGRYPMRHGLQIGVVRPWAQYGLPLDERTLPTALAETGYSTAIVGKWHLGHFQPEYLPTKRGFHHQYGHYNGAIDFFDHTRDGGFDWHRDDRVARDPGYSTTLIGDEAARIVREHDPARPLFLYVPFNAVHTPLQVPEAYKAPYMHMKEPRRTYAGMLAALDEAVGKVVAEIDRKGLRERTLFLFSSDNGGPNPGRVTSNGPLRGQKSQLYEGGVRVPAFASWKGTIRENSEVRAPMHVVDLYPTLLGLAGASTEQTKPIDGLDVWPVIQGKEGPKDRVILLNTTPSAGAVRVGNWKLVINGASGVQEEDPVAAKKKQARKPPTELFDLANDPYEKNDLAQARPEKRAELMAIYRKLAAEAVAPKSRPKAADFRSPAVWGER